MDLERYFSFFRRRTIGEQHPIVTPYGRRSIRYFDTTASGRLYRPIENRMLDEYGPLVGNTHSEATATGRAMTSAYNQARASIKKHLGAGPGDALIFEGSGMTGAVVKLQRMLGLKVPDWVLDRLNLTDADRPVVFVTHLEHHSNHTSWIETIAQVVVVPPGEDGLVSLENLEQLLKQYQGRTLIGSFSACSNVTGISTPVHEMAALMHRYGGVCFVDYAASAPYVDINMHPGDPSQALDAVMFSPHKFLGGPGTPGVLVVNKSVLTSEVPDRPGGGTVKWTNPWGEHAYVDDIEAREDGGTPPFLQGIKAGLAVALKEEMGTVAMADRKKELIELLFAGLDEVPGLQILASQHRDRQGIVSFTLDGFHHGLVATALNDIYGIQTRDGCSCAGTYGHYLMGIDPERSREITSKIDHGDHSSKPGWVRISLHPTHRNADVEYATGALREIAKIGSRELGSRYDYDPASNEFHHKGRRR